MKKQHTLIYVIMGIFLMALWCGAQVDYDKAKALYKENKKDEAIVLLKQTIQNFPSNLDAYYLLGQIYLEKNQLDSAAFWGRKMLEIDNNAAKSYIVVTQALAQKKNFKEALILIDKGLKRTKNSQLLLMHKGSIYVLADSAENAVAAYTMARDAEPQNVEVYKGLYNAYLKLGAEAMAVMQLEKGIELDSTQVDMSYKLAKHYYKVRRYNDAAKCYLRVLRMDPTNDQAAWELGQLYYAAKKYELAVNILEPFVKRQPDNHKAWLIYLESLIKVDRYSEAKTTAEHILAKEKNSIEAFRALAKAEYYLKEYDLSVKTYQSLAKLDTLSAEDYKLYGKSYMELKTDSTAVKYFDLSLKKDRNQKDVWTDLGTALMRLKKWEQSADAFQQRILIDSTSASAYINYALSNMAIARWENARKALYKALSLQPTYLKGHLHLARCLSQMDSLAAARIQYQQTIELAEKQGQGNYKAEVGEAYKMISFSYLLEKNLPRALDALTKTVEYKNDDSEVHLWRAQTLHALDKRKEAEAEYQKVLKLDPNNKDAKKGLEIIAQQN
jgi:tetratricopeptide (TPR) repeat protein